MANFRSPKLLRYAKDAPRCMSCCRHNNNDVVMAHANWSKYGKGMSIKANDWAVATMCGTCHSELDQGSKMNREDRKEVWRARQEVFTGNFPASTLVQVAALAEPAMKVEIEAIAHLGASAA